MALSEGEIEKIASLARLALSEEEKKRFGAELEAILGFLAEQEGLEPPPAPPMSGGTRAETIMRPDEPVSEALEGGGDALIKSAPAKKDRWISVKEIFE